MPLRKRDFAIAPRRKRLTMRMHAEKPKKPILNTMLGQSRIVTELASGKVSTAPQTDTPMSEIPRTEVAWFAHVGFELVLSVR